MSAEQTERLGAIALTFAIAAARCETLPSLCALATAAIAEVGMTALASGMITGPRVARHAALHFHTWSDAWLATYATRGFMDVDPLPRWALVSGTPARWTEILAKLPPTDPGQAIATAAREFGYSEGVVVPARTLRGQLGLVSVGGPHAAIDDASFEFLVMVCQVTHRRADALDDAATPVPKLLSRREQECVALLIQGLTEREIGDSLGISEVTARFHLDNARLKTGARSRTHLAGIAGLWLGTRAHLPKPAEAPPSRD